MSWPEAVATVGVVACIAVVWIITTVCNYLENKEHKDD